MICWHEANHRRKRCRRHRGSRPNRRGRRQDILLHVAAERHVPIGAAVRLPELGWTGLPAVGLMTWGSSRKATSLRLTTPIRQSSHVLQEWMLVSASNSKHRAGTASATPTRRAAIARLTAGPRTAHLRCLYGKGRHPIQRLPNHQPIRVFGRPGIGPERGL